MQEEWRWFDVDGRPVRAPSAAEAAREAGIGVERVHGPYRTLDHLLSERDARRAWGRLRRAGVRHRG